MVVGNGLIASAFHHFASDDSVVIFGSGVSNSYEQNQAAFLREENLIRQFTDLDKLFVYFSTCSIYDASLIDSLYIQHKVKMEKLIQQSFARYLIVRLPNVVGKCSNPFTLMNYFYNQIGAQKEIIVQKNSSRYLVHIEEVKNIVTATIQSDVQLNLVADLVIYERMTILEIVRALEKFCSREANIRIVDSGSDYVVRPHPIFEKYIIPMQLNKLQALPKLIALTYK